MTRLPALILSDVSALAERLGVRVLGMPTESASFIRVIAEALGHSAP